MANIGWAVTTYRELMQQQVHEEGYFVAVQYVGAVDGAAGACQVVGVHGGAEGPDVEEKKTESLSRGLKSADVGREGCNWDASVWPRGTGEDYLLSSARANTLSRICGSLRVQFVFARQRHISLTSAGEGGRREE